MVVQRILLRYARNLQDMEVHCRADWDKLVEPWLETVRPFLRREFPEDSARLDDIVNPAWSEHQQENDAVVASTTARLKAFMDGLLTATEAGSRLKIWRQVRNSIGLFITGVGVGWLIGLSVSPVIQGVITALIGFVVAVASVLVGITVNEHRAASAKDETQPISENSRRHSHSIKLVPLPMACLIAGIAIGASVGVYARTNNWLGPNPTTIMAQWKGTGLDDKEVARSVLFSLYSAGSSSEIDHRSGVLFATVSQEVCETLRWTPDEQLERAMAASSDKRIREFTKKCSGHTTCLKAAVEELLCSQYD